VAELGKPVSGHAAIRGVMTGFIASKPRIEMKVLIVVQSGDLALTVSEYTTRSTGPDGKQTATSARGTGVVRRQTDDTWRFVIDNPTGTA
jgi:ketosteroid isomerase-like protein